MRRLFAVAYLLPVSFLAACGTEAPSAQKCEADSTLGVVQAIFDARGCTAGTCHGADASTAAAGLVVSSNNSK